MLLFSSDLKLSALKMIDYYSLRFQIEFNFRDTKQYWGLEDFMNVKKTPMNNAANLSLFMVNVSAKMLNTFRSNNTACSVLDLKAHHRAMKYLEETLKILPQKPESIVIEQNHTASLFYRCYLLHTVRNKSRIIGEGIDNEDLLINPVIIRHSVAASVILL